MNKFQIAQNLNELREKRDRLTEEKRICVVKGQMHYAKVLEVLIRRINEDMVGYHFEYSWADVPGVV